MKPQSKGNLIFFLVPVIAGAVELGKAIIKLIDKDDPAELKDAKEAKYKAIISYCQNTCPTYIAMKKHYKGRFLNCRRIRCQYYWETHGGTKEIKNGV